MFNIGPSKISRELLLSKHSEEEYMTHYLGINTKYGLFNSPLRKDDNPTCSFYRDKRGVLIFKDFGTGFHGDFLNVVMEIFKVPYHRALNIVANDFGIIDKPGYIKNEAKCIYDGSKVEQTEQTIIQCEIKEYTEEELEWWGQYGITPKILKKFNVFSVKNVFLNGNYFCSSSKINPVYGYFFGIKDGIEQWKIYFPFKTSYRFLLNTSVIQGLKQIPKTGEHLVITKSMKDVMTLYALGVPAIAPQAESVVLTRKQGASLSKRFELLITNGDWDRAGQNFMIKSRKNYPTICLSFKDKKKHGKDISDFVSMHGTEKGSLLVNKIRMVLKAKNPIYMKHLEYYKP